MDRYIFKLPDIGEGTAEAEIVAWHVKVGDVIQEDENLVDVMTDKATVEMTSPVSGKVVALHGEPGDMAPVGSPLVELEVEGVDSRFDVRPAMPPVKAETVQAPKPAMQEALPQAEHKAPAVARAAAQLGKPLASPAVRQRARESAVELQLVRGSGPAGRITHSDLDGYLASGGHAAPAPAAWRDGVEDIKVIGLRRKIAEKMQDAKRRIPHFAYVEEVDMTEIESLRAHLNAVRRAEQPKLTVIPFLMRALVSALPEFPQINARFDDEADVIHRHAAIHIGIATQTVNGLIVPVVRHAEALDIWESAAAVSRVAAAARDNKATKEELSGSTITITSLGALGGVVTTPVINHPEVAIISPNAIIERPVVRLGQIVVRKTMNLSSCYDHRVVDGYDAAKFIQRIKSLLEHPATLFMN